MDNLLEDLTDSIPNLRIVKINTSYTPKNKGEKSNCVIQCICKNRESDNWIKEGCIIEKR